MSHQDAFSVLPTVTNPSRSFNSNPDTHPTKKKKGGAYLLKYILTINFLEYLEAGAVPALLMQLTRSFHMSPGQLGLLGGIVYISLSLASPFAGYLLRHYDHQQVIGLSITINNIFTLLWALTPVDYTFSTNLFIALRFFMGATQCVVCMFLPLWINEFAPTNQKTSWMSYQQASVPFGVMMGYILASLTTLIADPHNPIVDAPLCYGILCWRWPFLIEVFLLTPFCIAIFLVPREHVTIRISSRSSNSITAHNKLTIDLDKSPDTKDHDIIPSPTILTPLKNTKQVSYTDAITTATTTTTSSSIATPSESNANQYVEMKNFLSNPNAVNTDSNYINSSPLHRPHHNHASPSTSTSTGIAKGSESDDSSDDDYGSYNPHLQAEERNRKRRLRRHSMTASMVDPFYTRNVVRPSYDDLPTLESSQDLLSMLPNLNWSSSISSSQASSTRDIEAASGIMTSSSKPSTPRRAISSFDDQNQSSPSSHHPWSWMSPLSLPWTRTPAKESASSSSLMIMTPVNPVFPYITDEPRHMMIGVGDEESRGRSDSNFSEPSPRLYTDLPSLSSSRTISSRTVKDRSNSECSVESMISSPAYVPYGSTLRIGTQSNHAINTISTTSGIDDGLTSSSAIMSLDEIAASGMMRARGGSGSSVQSTSSKLKAKTAANKPAMVYTSLRDVAKQSQIVDTSLLSTLRRRLSGNTIKPLRPSSTKSNDSSNDLCSSNNRSFASETNDSSKSQTADYGQHIPLLSSTIVGGDQMNRKSYTIGEEKDGDMMMTMNHQPQYDANMNNQSIRRTSSTSSSARPIQVDDGYTMRNRVDSFSSSDSGSDNDSFDLNDYHNLLNTDKLHINTNDTNPILQPHPNTPNALNPAPSTSSTLWLSMMKLYRMPVYSNLLGAMTALYFTVTGVQYWGTTYLSVSLGAPLPLVNLLFILCAATGPTLGVFFGGWFIDVLGGYRGMRQRTVALELCCMFGFLGCCFAIPVSLFSDVYLAVGFLWAVLFMGAAVLPACSGMLVSIVPRRHRPLSQSITLVVCNMFGYSASLLVSGYLMQFLQAWKSSSCDEACSLTWGFRLILSWSFVSFIFLLRALLDSYKAQERKQALTLRRSSIYTYIVDEVDKSYHVYTSI